MDHFLRLYGLDALTMKRDYGVHFEGSALVANASFCGQSAESYVIGILSDVQEAASLGDAELSRQLANRAKFMLHEMHEAREAARVRVSELTKAWQTKCQEAEEIIRGWQDGHASLVRQLADARREIMLGAERVTRVHVPPRT